MLTCGKTMRQKGQTPCSLNIGDKIEVISRIKLFVSRTKFECLSISYSRTHDIVVDTFQTKYDRGVCELS